MSIISSRNLTMMTDLYQITMMYGYYKKGMDKNIAVFDLFFRDTKANSSYAVMAGTESLIEYINSLHFSNEDLDYLRSLKLFDDDFIELLRNFHFTGEIYAMEEGTIVYPYEPLVRVTAPILEAQLIETAILNLINHQTLIATKANRVCYAAGGERIMEFGLRRAQGPDAGIYGARAAMIGGCSGTSNVLTGQIYNVPVSGTHAHSWVMSFPTELEAFRAYAEIFPNSCMLLVDTYDTLRSGVPNAITVFRELREKGYEGIGIRIDSGDLAYISKRAREMLDDAGFPNVTICASGDLDEDVINSLHMQGARIDSWGVGTKLITSDDKPALGGVYKMSAEIVDGVVVPKIKISENPAKITNPGIKTVYRIYDKERMSIADLIALREEKFDITKPLTIYHPDYTFKRMTINEYTMRELLVPIFIDGKQVYKCPSMNEIREYAKSEMDSLWEESKRLLNPQVYRVDLSDGLYDLKNKLIREHRETALYE